MSKQQLIGDVAEGALPEAVAAEPPVLSRIMHVECVDIAQEYREVRFGGECQR